MKCFFAFLFLLSIIGHGSGEHNEDYDWQGPTEIPPCDSPQILCELKKCFWGLEFLPYDSEFLTKYLEAFDTVNSELNPTTLYRIGQRRFDEIFTAAREMPETKWAQKLLSQEVEYRERYKSDFIHCWIQINL